MSVSAANATGSQLGKRVRTVMRRVRSWTIHRIRSFASDESTYLTIVLRMLKTGDLNPHWWFYPSLMHYLDAGGLGLVSALPQFVRKERAIARVNSNR